MNEHVSVRDGRTRITLALFIQRELDGDVCDAEQTRQQAAVESGDTLSSVDGQSGV